MNREADNTNHVGNANLAGPDPIQDALDILEDVQRAAPQKEHDLIQYARYVLEVMREGRYREPITFLAMLREHGEDRPSVRDNAAHVCRTAVFRKRYQESRKKCGKPSIRDIAAAADLDKDTVLAIQRSGRRPHEKTIRKLATALRVDADYLLGLSDDPCPNTQLTSMVSAGDHDQPPKGD